MNLNDVVVRTEGLYAAPVDKDIVILNEATNNYIALDEIGREIWDLLAEPRRVGDLAAQLSEQYDATAEQIAADILPFLDELERDGMVKQVKG